VATLSAAAGVGATPQRSGRAIFIKKVDGQDVSELGATFELLPGCHVVEPEVPVRAGGPADTVGPLALVFPMQAGHAYTVVVNISSSGLGGQRKVYGVEQNLSWQTTATFQPVVPDGLNTCP